MDSMEPVDINIVVDFAMATDSCDKYDVFSGDLQVH
jgi:hypothetical protein